MSYTAPTNIQTKADAVLALAGTIAGEDKTALGDGSVNTALDVLADVLAGQDVEVPQTNAGAILALAQYVQGGGGASLTGNLAQLWGVRDEPSEFPQEGDPVFASVSIGGKVVAEGDTSMVIAGADVATTVLEGAWLIVPTSATFDPNTGNTSVEFTKTALAVEDNTVHIPESIPEPLASEYEYEGETFTDYFYPCVCIDAGGK